MTTTPLKTASRALSFATLLVAGFAIWVVGQQAFSPHDPTQPNALTPASEVADSASQLQPQPDAASAQGSPLETVTMPVPLAATTPTKNTARREVQKPTPTPEIFFEATSPTPEAQTSQPQLAGKRPPSAERSDEEQPPHRDHVATAATHRGAGIQPPLGRMASHDPNDFFDDAASARVESQLSKMQRQLDRFAQVQSDQKSDELQKARELLDQLQRERDTDKLEKLMQDLNELKNKARAEPIAPARKPDDPIEIEPPLEEAPRTGPKGPGVLKAEPFEGHSDKLSIEFQDVDINKALAMLGQLSGMNILIGRGVSGNVPTANLQDVTAEEALDAITKSLNYVYEKEGNFVFVSTVADSLQRKQSNRKMVTKVFRPRYISVRDLQTLVTPLLTKPGGLIAVTNPAEMGLEESRTKGGGNSLSQTDALLIVDFPEVLAQVDTVITEIDVPPSQVVIEALILSVTLTESMKLGVNFALLGGNNKALVTSGNGAQLGGVGAFPDENSLLPAAGDFIANTAGLKYGFLAGDVAGFVEALETLADTSVVASPSVRVLNKQRAELIIGKRLGYTTTTFNGTQSIQNINFLEVGTKLILRPYVADDGLVRMEIHPERSDGEVVDGLPNSRTTEVTSNVMVRDGTTIVIGGLIEEQATQSTSRIPGLGALPVVGNLFKSKSNNTQRTELIVLITPRVIHDVDAACEGQEAQVEHERRHEQFRNKMSKIGRTNLANIEYERAARKFEEGDYDKARFHIEKSLLQNRLDEDALRLKDQIDSQITDRKRWFQKARRKPPVEFHRNPSAPPSLPTDAVFDQEFSIPTQSPIAPTPEQPLLIPPVPSAAPDEQPTAPSAKNNSAKLVR